MIPLETLLEPVGDVLRALGVRAKEARLARNLTQIELAQRSGVGSATIKRFERTGNVSLENALRIAIALNAEEGFKRLFEAPRYKTIDEVVNKVAPHTKQRAPRRRS